MKLNAGLAKSLLMAASIGTVVPVHTRLTAKEDDAAVAAAKVPGVYAPRAKGGYVALAVEGGVLVLRFLDAQKREVAPDVTRALARWNPVGTVSEQRSVLQAGESGKALTGVTKVRPPLKFKVYLTLYGADESSNEALVVDLRE